MKAIPLRIPFSNNGKDDRLYPVLLKGNNDLVLVDCGYPGFLPKIQKAASALHYNLADLTGILITHHDLDHNGGLYEFKQKWPHLKVFASSTEAPFINGEKKSLRLAQAEAIFPKLPEDQKAGATLFIEMLQKIEPVKVDVPFEVYDPPELFSEAQIMETPGHTPGHISIYLPHTKQLVAGDAVVFENDELDIANPEFTLDLDNALHSVNKLASLQVKELICYHGGPVLEDLTHHINNLLKKYHYAPF
jgi:glyoxylase-like metal-dependent hydrolase (beta-lactamase superfamily II)